MDINTITLAGSIANVERKSGESGRTLRILVAVRSEQPRRRVDVVPVIVLDPSDDIFHADYPIGSRVLVAGALQRRFWSAGEGRKSRLEVVAHEVTMTAGILTSN